MAGEAAVSPLREGVVWPWGWGETEQDMSGDSLSFMAGHLGGRKVGKRPALLMLQGIVVSMAAPRGTATKRA